MLLEEKPQPGLQNLEREVHVGKWLWHRCPQGPLLPTGVTTSSRRPVMDVTVCTFGDLGGVNCKVTRSKKQNTSRLCF